MGTLLFKVEETFLIRGRGLVLAPGVPNATKVKVGDLIELRRPGGQAVPTRVRGVEFVDHRAAKVSSIAILIGLECARDDVPIGTEIWTV